MNWFQGSQQTATGQPQQINPWSWMNQGAQPQGAYSPQMVSGARADLLAQLGMGLMAAGQPMSGAQRAQYLAGLGQLPANYQTDLAARLKLQQEQVAYQQQQAAYAQQQAYAEVLSKATPEQLKQLGIPESMADIWKSMPAASKSSFVEKKLGSTTDPVNWQTVQTDQGVIAFNPQNPTQTMRVGGTPQKSPELVTLTPPQGSKDQPQTLNVADPTDYAKAHDLLTKGWNRQSAATTVQIGAKLNEQQARTVQLYPNIYQDKQQLEQLDQQLTSPTGALATKYGGNFAAYAQGPEYQMADRAASDFAANLLYIRSGATARPDEIEATKKAYFPQPGDSAKVIAAKKQARDTAMMGLKASLGEQGAVLDPLEQQLNQQQQAPRVRTYNPQTGQLE
jgi:hypothetical protein